mgnify:CR=1 FL=1
MKETIPEEGLEHFDEYLQNYSKNENHPLKILLGFYKGKKLQCAKGFFWLICQRSPVWVTPIVTANIIDIATNSADSFQSGDCPAFYQPECLQQLHGYQAFFRGQPGD